MHHNSLNHYREHGYVDVRLSDKHAEGITEYKNFDESFTFELWDALLPKLGMHDIFKLFTVCKTLRKHLYEKPIKLQFNLDNFLIDAYENKCENCMNCVSYSSEMEIRLFVVTCKKLKLDDVLKYCKFHYLIITPDFVAECLANVKNRDVENKKSLLKYISNFKVKYNFESLKIICKELDGSLDKEIITNLSKNMTSPFSDEETKLLLPLYFKGDLSELIVRYGKLESNYELIRTTENYLFLLNLINDNLNNFSSENISKLLRIFIQTQDIVEKDMNAIAKMASIYGDESIIKHLLSIIDNPDDKISLVPKAYKYSRSDELDFLNNTKEWNLMSINYFSTGPWNKMYIDKLSEDEVLQIIINTEDKKKKISLINSAKITTNNPKIKQIINWAFITSNLEHVTKFAFFDFLDIRLRIQLIPAVYKYNSEETKDLKFLDTNYKLNELSIREALKRPNNNGFVFCSHLNNDTIFKHLYSIFTSPTYPYKVPKVLIKNIKTDNFKFYDKTYARKDSQTNNQYQPKIDNKIYNAERFALLLTANDIESYRKIYDKVVNDLYKINYKLRDEEISNKSEIIDKIISHSNFNLIRPSRVIALLKLCYSDYNICQKIILNHNFFENLYFNLEIWV